MLINVYLPNMLPTHDLLATFRGGIKVMPAEISPPLRPGYVQNKELSPGFLYYQNNVHLING